MDSGGEKGRKEKSGAGIGGNQNEQHRYVFIENYSQLIDLD
jgi:hypothetical protein